MIVQSGTAILSLISGLDVCAVERTLRCIISGTGGDPGIAFAITTAGSLSLIQKPLAAKLATPSGTVVSGPSRIALTGHIHYDSGEVEVGILGDFCGVTDPVPTACDSRITRDV